MVVDGGKSIFVYLAPFFDSANSVCSVINAAAVPCLEYESVPFSAQIGEPFIVNCFGPILQQVEDGLVIRYYGDVWVPAHEVPSLMQS